MKEFKLSSGSSIVLDLIRGLSAQIVVIGHGISFFGIFTFLHEPNFPWMQNIAVLIFFLLSGYLITYSTVRKKMKIPGYGFKHYFSDRFSRIYTAFVPSIVFIVLIDLVSRYMNPELYSFNSAFNLKTFLANLLMLQDHAIFSYTSSLKITSFGSARPFWTLAIEWWIYLCFGYFILVFLRKKKINISNLIILGFFSLVPVYNLIMGRGHGLTTYWLFGALIYLISTLNILNSIRQRVKIILTIMICGLAFLRAYIQMEAYDPIFAFLLAIVIWLIIDIFKNIEFSKAAVNIIRYNASYSYTLYLIHYSILDFLFNHFSNQFNSYILFLVGFLLSNVLSALIGRYTELNLTKKVKQYLYTRIEIKKLST